MTAKGRLFTIFLLLILPIWGVCNAASPEEEGGDTSQSVEEKAQSADNPSNSEEIPEVKPQSLVLDVEEEPSADPSADSDSQPPSQKPNDFEDQIVNSAAQVQSAVDKKKKSSKNALKDESDIPVLTGDSDSNSISEGGTFFRMIMSIGVILLAGGGVILFGRWWKKNHKVGAETTKIQMMTQHHLGPKKSLAIVRVAGESILIGVTDHTISHIKTLSFIEEEGPDEFPEDFSGQLEAPLEESATSDNESIGNEGAAREMAGIEKSTESLPSQTSTPADQSITSIKDVVAQRLKEMRSL